MKRISRRAILRGSLFGGTVAIGLPWLEAMVPSRAEAQAGGAPKRVVFWFTANGTRQDLWSLYAQDEVYFLDDALTLTVGAPGSPRSVTLINGAQARNVFWRVGSSATINAAGGGTMVGTIISSAATSFSTSGNAIIVTLNGRALALNASVTMVNTVINVPAP